MFEQESGLIFFRYLREAFTQTPVYVNTRSEAASSAERLHALRETRLFVFPTGVPKENEDPWLLMDGFPQELSLPFPVMGLEALDKKPLVRMLDQGGIAVDIFAFCVWELEPQKLRFLTIGRPAAEPDHWALSEYTEYPGMPCGMSWTTLHYLKQIRAGKLATERVNERLKIKGPDGRKELVKIKEVIHVRPRLEPAARGVYGGPLDYSHRWEVMGHWRKVEGIGKDRGGGYTVKGFTWVRDHVRGPESKPLVPKVRVVS
jgi:hypothetical protein